MYAWGSKRRERDTFAVAILYGWLCLDIQYILGRQKPIQDLRNRPICGSYSIYSNPSLVRLADVARAVLHRMSV